jgi:hypothetical protein
MEGKLPKCPINMQKDALRLCPSKKCRVNPEDTRTEVLVRTGSNEGLVRSGGMYSDVIWNTI